MNNEEKQELLEKIKKLKSSNITFPTAVSAPATTIPANNVILSPYLPLTNTPTIQPEINVSELVLSTYQIDDLTKIDIPLNIQIGDKVHIKYIETTLEGKVEKELIGIVDFLRIGSSILSDDKIIKFIGVIDEENKNEVRINFENILEINILESKIKSEIEKYCKYCCVLDNSNCSTCPLNKLKDYDYRLERN